MKENNFSFTNIKELSIKMIGFWNVRIFNPAWFTEYILKDLNIKEPLDFSIDLKNMVINGYKFDGIEFMITNNIVNIKVEENNLKQIENANIILIKILKLLPFTPINGIGFNVVYNFPVSSDIKFVKEFKNIQKITEDSFSLNTYTKSLKEKDCLINVVITENNSDNDINFNFHYDKNYNFEIDTFFKKIKKTQIYLYE